MIYKLTTKTDLETIRKSFPKGVFTEIERITTTLDICYNRFGYDGGYALIAETVADLQEVKSNYIDYTTEPPELIREINGFVSILYLPATEYSISLILPVEIMKEVGIHEQI